MFVLPHLHRLRTSNLWPILLALLILIPFYGVEKDDQLEADALTPTFLMDGGAYNQDIQVALAVADESAIIRFTLDGRAPTRTEGTRYTQPILLPAPTVAIIRARAFPANGEPGPVASETYFVGLPATIPVVSLLVEPADLWDPERGIYANPQHRGREWERPVDITYVEADGRAGFRLPAGLRIHGGFSRNDPKKSLRLYFRQEYGAGQLEYPLFANSELTSFRRLILHAGGQDSTQTPTNWTLLRHSLVDWLAFQLNGYATHSRPVVLFLNGELWGIYHLRERIDEHFLTDEYGVAAADILDAPEQIQHEPIVSGNREHWDHLLHFVESHDLADPDHYAYVQTQIDVANLIDYNLLQMYVANSDWPFHNVHQFRPQTQGGPWHWLIWDADHSFGYYPGSDPARDMTEFAFQREHPHTTNRHTLLIRRLQANPDFRQHFLVRAAHLLNTTFTAERVISQINAQAAALAPNIDYEIARWSQGPVSWPAHVEEMRDFARRRPAAMRQHLANHFGLPGTARIHFNPPALGAGTVAVNGELLSELPWYGDYFQTTQIEVTAVPQPGYRFEGWEEVAGGPLITVTVAKDQSLTPRFVRLDAGVPQPGDALITAYGYTEDGQNWIEFQVTRPGGLDLRGWRVTDNDSKGTTDEGSLILGPHPALARVPAGTILRLVTATMDTTPPPDDLDSGDGTIILYAGNGLLDSDSDPWFNLAQDDNLVLLAPGPTENFDDDLAIAFMLVGKETTVTPASFGILAGADDAP